MKQYLIGEASELTGLSRDTLRFYEKKGLIRSERKENGYRVYSEEEPDTWWYYLSSNGRAIKQTGSNAKVATVPTKAGNAKFIFDDLGRMMSGWIGSDGQMLSGEDAWREGVYYSDPENGGRLVVNSWAYIHAEDPENEDRDGDGYWFYFDGSGKKVTDKVNKLINGRKYRFNEYGLAHYDWYENASESSASYYYSEEEQCWLRTDWFKAIPDPERDPEGYDMGEEYWYYADKKGQIAASEIRNIRGVRYGFDEYGKMLHGLYILDMADDGETIYINGRRIEADSDMRYEQFEYGGESYLISAAGKIMKGRTNVKDADGYYYCTDKKGVVTYYGEERYKKQ